MARRAHAEGHGSSERWLLTYSDLITLLLAFFIILYAGSQADLDKFGKLAKGLSQAFGVTVMEGAAGGSESGVLEQTTGLFDFGQLSPAQRAFLSISEKLQAYAKQQGVADQVAVNIKAEGIAITLSNALLFPSGGVDLSPESQAALDQIADLIRPMPNEIRIEAHTDNLPTDSSAYPTNWELSAARAAVVTRYLSEKANIDPKRLAALGYGEYRPLMPNDTRDNRLRNRRADIIILYPSEKPAPVVNLLGQGLKQDKGSK